jgi:dTDP-4-amino-4,6-dideoxygalactose transaminase
VTDPGNDHVWHVFALLTDRRDALQSHLAAQGVPTLIYYPQPLHLQRCYADQGWKEGAHPIAESLSRRILPLPMYPELTDEQADHVVRAVRGFFD